MNSQIAENVLLKWSLNVMKNESSELFSDVTFHRFFLWVSIIREHIVIVSSLDSRNINCNLPKSLASQSSKRFYGFVCKLRIMLDNNQNSRESRTKKLIAFNCGYSK